MAENIKNQKYYQDWKEVLIPRIRDDQAWSDLFDGISDVFAKNIYKYVQQLRYIRDPDQQEREVNIQQAKFLGFDYKSDLFTDLEYVNLVRFLNIYNKKYKGTQNFINFIGWIKNAKFKVVQLWAKGKKNYSDDPAQRDPFSRETPLVKNNSLVDGTGTQEWYPTSHVDLEYDAEAFKIEERDIWYLFYQCAPIHLVLRGISAVFTAETFPLFIHTAVNDYTNTHICIPCIYRYYVPLNLLHGEGRENTTNNMNYVGYAYSQNGKNQFLQLPMIDKQMVKDNLKLATFIRDSYATNQERNTYYLTQVPANYPRFAYLPQSPEHNLEGLGLLIEPQRTNLMQDSGKPVSRRVFLYPGTYCFTCNGKYRLWDVTNNKLIAEVENELYKFTLNVNTQINVVPLTVPDKDPWFQLELGDKPSSYILTTPQRVYTREADVLYYKDLSYGKKEGSFFLEWSGDNIVDQCTLLKVYTTSQTFVSVRKVFDKIVLKVVVSNKTIEEYEEDYKNSLYLSLKATQLTFNNHIIDFPNGNCPTPSYCYVGSDNGKEVINGYITAFNYYPQYH